MPNLMTDSCLCGHVYGSHTNGTEGPCSKPECACPHFTPKWLHLWQTMPKPHAPSPPYVIYNPNKVYALGTVVRDSYGKYYIREDNLSAKGSLKLWRQVTLEELSQPDPEGETWDE